MRRIDYIVIHCSASPAGMDIGAAEIDRWHRQRRFREIGYHFVIRRNGVLEKGRGLSRIGAHVKGYNRNSIGICWVGGLDDNQHPQDNRTAEQITTMRTLVAQLKEIWPNAQVKGHRDFPNVHKDCPCFDVKTEL